MLECDQKNIINNTTNVQSMHLLITSPSGFEKQAMQEISALLKEKDRRSEVRTTYFKGLLLAETSLSRDEAHEILRQAETKYVNKVLPIEKIVSSSVEEIKKFFESRLREMDIKSKRAAARCARRGKHGFSSVEVEREVGAMLKSAGATIDLKNPELIFLAEVVQDYACVSVLRAEEIIHKTPVAMRKWAPGERPVSRAELKMRELIRRFPEIFSEQAVALDIGAAPGGWSRAMAAKVKKVIAVDAAELNEDVKSLPNVLHIKIRAENLALNEQVDILTNDANLLHGESARLSVELANKYLKPSGYLLHTVKLGVVPETGKRAAKSLSAAAEEVKQIFEKSGVEIISVLKLRYNTRNEVTIVARRRE